MATRGGKRKGAGRKSNATKLLAAGFVCAAFSKDVQEQLWNSMLNSSDENIRLKATMYLTDRLYGKPKQEMAVENTGGPMVVFHNVPRPERD